jgi:hypothetical protein
MDRLRKVEVDGEWWAQTPDGSWLYWSRAAATWKRRSAGPPGVPRMAPSTDESLDRTRVGLLPGPSAPDPEDPYKNLGPVDQWFNRNFPPYSGRRLLFGLVGLPIVGLCMALVRRFTRGQHLPLSLFLFSTVVGGVLLTLVWIGVVKRRAPSMRSSHQPAADAGPERHPRPLPRFTSSGFLVGAGVFFVDLTLFLLISDPAASPSRAVAIAAPGAILASLLWQLRTSVAGLFLLSALIGAPIAMVLTMFGVVMGKQPSFLLYWLVSSVLALIFLLPVWWELRQREQGLGRSVRMPWAHRAVAPLEVPAWVLWTGVSILMLSTAAYIRIG